ncbi:hypothetical protein CXB51_020172 [Gossypium anomalum]|uniref:Pectinesterase inhibitor domain-containing protein n=1 Tax=Gossypium anomalum TaxID=47600 RepID=A0A8J5YPX5_9ROSI|nr:hypothetical protein CXB51_020172 [Gossypium anomalum]
MNINQVLDNLIIELHLLDPLSSLVFIKLEILLVHGVTKNNQASFCREFEEIGSSFFSIKMAALLILIHLATLLNSSLAVRKLLGTQMNIETEFIRTSCGTTTDPGLCMTTFSGYASEIQASPKLLARTALSVSLNTTRSASTVIAKLSKSHGLTPKEIAAIRDCVEELKDSVDELKRACDEMGSGGGKSFVFQMSDIQTWVSAALTDEDTCMDGFSGKYVNGNLKTTVRRQIVEVAHLISIALTFVNQYAAHP